jgi:hypothetical protein
LGDRPAVDKVVADAKAKGYGLKDLVVAVVQNEAFRKK